MSELTINIAHVLILVLGIVIFGIVFYKVFLNKANFYRDNPCECGHKDFYHVYKVGSERGCCERCNCKKFKEDKK